MGVLAGDTGRDEAHRVARCSVTVQHGCIVLWDGVNAGPGCDEDELLQEPICKVTHSIHMVREITESESFRLEKTLKIIRSNR